MKCTLGGYFCLIVAGCAPHRAKFVIPFELSNHKWETIYTDSAYIVSLDVANVESGPEAKSFEVWYQNQHTAKRKHEGQEWNREVIRSLLRCEPLSFKTMLTTIFLDNGPPVAQIGKSPSEISKEDWRLVIPGSVDEGSLSGACKLLQEQGRLSD